MIITLKVFWMDVFDFDFNITVIIPMFLMVSNKLYQTNSFALYALKSQ